MEKDESRERSRHGHHRHHSHSRDHHKREEAADDSETRKSSSKSARSRSRSHHKSRDRRHHSRSRDHHSKGVESESRRSEAKAPAPSGASLSASVAPSVSSSVAPGATGGAPPRKRKSNFDVKPAGMEDSLLVGNNARPLGNPYDFGINPIKSLHARRVYLGGVGDCTEDELEKWFTTMITKSATKPLPCKPVVSVFLNREKRYAFVEFYSVDMTTQVMGLNGLMFQGNPMKIRRPNDFSPSMLPPEDPNAPRLDLRKLGVETVTDVKFDEYTPKIVFSSVPPKMSERDLKPIFDAFGRLLSLQIFRDAYTLESKCYGFAEYEDAVIAEVASSGLDGFDIGDATISVKKATQDNITLAAQSDTSNDLSEVMREIAGGNFIPKQPTRVIALRNIIPKDSLGLSDQLDEYRQDFKEECSRFGTVTSLEIPTEVTDIFDFGIIYVEFEFLEEARTALFQMYGKKYKERIMFAHYFDEIRYVSKDFSS